MFDWITGLLLMCLSHLSAVTHDWGIAVMVLTVFVRMLVLPLSAVAAKHAVRQAELAPRLEALAEGWSGSRTELAMAQRELLKQHGIRPMASTLPMVLQIPVFLSLYRFCLSLDTPLYATALLPWVTHLSLADPFHILPLAAAIVAGIGAWVTYTPAPAHATLWFSGGIAFVAALMVLWRAPIAVGLYYFTSSLTGALERWLLRKRYQTVTASRQT